VRELLLSHRWQRQPRARPTTTSLARSAREKKAAASLAAALAFYGRVEVSQLLLETKLGNRTIGDVEKDAFFVSSPLFPAIARLDV